jgi:hypothetical protein
LISRPIDRRGFLRFAAISFAAISGRIARLVPRSSRADGISAFQPPSRYA